MREDDYEMVVDETDDPTDDKDRNHNESYCYYYNHYNKMPNHLEEHEESIKRLKHALTKKNFSSLYSLSKL